MLQSGAIVWNCCLANLIFLEHFCFPNTAQGGFTDYDLISHEILKIILKSILQFNKIIR